MVIPVSQEAAGGTSELDVFNPGSSTASVTVQLRLSSGPLAPLTAQVGPGSTWALATSAQTRIPQGEDYSATVRATGSDVVVGRTVQRPAPRSHPRRGWRWPWRG